MITAPRLRDIALALVLVAATTLALLLIDRWIELASHSTLYVVSVIAAATRWGMVPAIVAAVSGAAASAFFFYPPIFSLQVLDIRHVVDLILFMIVAVVTSRLATGLKQQTELARRRDEETKIRAEMDALREALIGSVSHELRTPVASIMGAATVLRDAPTIAADRRLAALAMVIREETERLDADIRNLLDATRISNEGIRPRLEWVEAADIVDSALKRTARTLAGRQLDVALADDLPLLRVDAVLMEQALVQILANAAKYSPAGEPIAVRAASIGDAVEIAVSDRGLGFDENELEHFAERFFRGDRHGSIPGTGLGLWIARAFVTASGGTLAAISGGPGTGAVVTIRVPANARVSEEEDAEPAD